MGLRDALRHAEQQGKEAAQRGADLARAGIEAAEAGLRRKVRMGRKSAESQRATASQLDPEQEREAVPPAKVRTGIVSVNGQDVGQVRCTGR